jgi:hypothetical protein
MTTLSVSPVANAHRSILWLIVGLALLLRWVHFPHPREMRDYDEPGYLKGSLAILEGLPAGYKAAPAGPNFWVGWVYTAGVTAVHCVHPGPEELRVPLQVRPFVALEQALFDQYHDLGNLHLLWVTTQLLLAIWATYAAFRAGFIRGGLAGGIFLGGFMAVLPMFVDFTDMSRPYMTAWSFGVIAYYYAIAKSGRGRLIASGIFLGLAVASRIEMLLFMPVVLWEFWHRREGGWLIAAWLKMLGTVLVTTLVAAPWLLTHLIGNLRTIATVRLGPDPHGGTTLVGNLVELAWHQGLAGAMLAFAVVILAMFLPGTVGTDPAQIARPGDRVRLAILGLYVALLLASLGKGTVFLHQQGPIVLALIVFGAFAAGPMNRWVPKYGPWISAVLLLVPLGQSIALIVTRHRMYAPEAATAWVEQHVPAGTIVYTEYSLHDLLPTPASAASLWEEVTDDNAWRRKFEAGMQRFHLDVSQIPPALSEENLVQERGNRRGQFIMGGRTDLPEPRFDIRIFNGSPVFGVQDIASAFARTGGVVIWTGDPAPASFGTPVASWVSATGIGTFIYCSADVRALPSLHR